MTPDINHLRQWIGRRETASEQVTAAMVGRFNAIFDVGDKVVDGDPAPSMLHWCLAQPAVPGSGLGPDGHAARGGFLPPVPLPRRMWAGGAIWFHGDIHIGEEVTRCSAIRDIAIKQGRRGPLCLVTVDHRIHSADRMVIEERQDIVYLAADPTPPADRSAPIPAPPGTRREMVTPTAPLLFRYSALTFNSHRIHYDTPYAQAIEGYPGLVVHGPLQATQLVHLAERVRGSRPARFDFRAYSPLFDTADYSLNAVEDGRDLRLWTAACAGGGGENCGPVAMEARATW